VARNLEAHLVLDLRPQLRKGGELERSANTLTLTESKPSPGYRNLLHILMIVISGGLWLLVVIPVEIQRARSKRHLSVTVQEGEDGIPLVALKGAQEWVESVQAHLSTGPSPGPAPGARSSALSVGPDGTSTRGRLFFYALGRVGGPIAGKNVSRDVFSCHRIQKGEYLSTAPTCGVDLLCIGPGLRGVSGPIGPVLCKILDANFREDLFHALR